MRNSLLSAITLIAATVAASDAAEKRELGAHLHGFGSLNIAIEGDTVAMELEAPGADIVGFEHAATSEKDRAAIATAISGLAKPLDLFVLPASAGCTVTAANVALIGENEPHGEDHHEEHHSDDKHAKHEGHSKHEEHATHKEHGDEESHTEFHAEYTLECTDPSALDRIEFAYFERFPSAKELAVQIISDKGAQAFEVERDAPVLDLRRML